MLAGDSKTEKATPKRRQDERKKGNVLISRDIIAVVSLAGSFFALKTLFPSMINNIEMFILKFFGYAGTKTALSENFLSDITKDFVTSFGIIAAPIILVAAGLSVAATLAQTRLLFVTDSLKPKFSRINPLEGIKRLFSLRSLFDVIKGILKISILIVILYNFVSGSLVTISRTMDMDLTASSSVLLELVMRLVIKICLAFVAIAVFDYFFQWWEYERQIKMSKQELKEEYKQMEGDPQIKGKIKEVQRKMAMSRMMQAVPKADVVIKNPTHYAVALKYDLDKDNAPILLAKGQDELALRIIREAEANGVYVMENRPLARAIYATTDLNKEIPPEFYGTVAEILVYIYKIKNKKLV